MEITKTCVYTNRKNTMEINITEDQYNQLKRGADIDELLPKITYEEREFLLTGSLQEDSYDEDLDHNRGQWEW